MQPSPNMGVVVAQEKIAAQIGADILRQGSNAVDAAVATGFAMAVT
jgi:gamma-glutamyltranspeptidase/glutathione hydrolase